MLQSGQIYYLRNFKESDGSPPKNRYCIILTIRKENYAVIFHKVTSQSYCDGCILKKGANYVNTSIELFYFPKNEIVGKNGFFFKLDSYVHMTVWNISDLLEEEFQSFTPILKDQMIDVLFNDLIYFIYKSKNIKQKYIKLLEPVLESLNP